MNSQIAETKTEVTEWDGDSLSRRSYATFLTNYIESRTSNSGESLTIALDASWGAGKTFFITKWSEDLIANKRGVITFDAWKNDFSAEPLISFMAELTHGMSLLRKQAPLKAKISNTLKEQSKSMLKGFGKAAGPASAVIAKAVIAKLTGVAVDKITAAVSSDDYSDMGDLDWEEIKNDAGDSLEKGLDVFFEKSLADHRSRSNAAGAFKASLELLVKTLQEAKVIEGPFYVFIDELDRCKPDFAIKLLEGIKHLFAVPGVVFVISTNLEQSSKSVQAIYGANFDGYGYLKRFFDFEFLLPNPDIYSFAKVLIKNQPLTANRNIDSGLNQSAYIDDDLLARSFEVIASACDLPLRSQKQVWTIASAAASGISSKTQISVLWLFYLASLKHSFPMVFKRINDSQLGRPEFKTLLENVGKTLDISLKSFKNHTDQRGFPNQISSTVPLFEVLYMYYQTTYKTISDISTNGERDGQQKYPENLTYHMIAERPNPFFAQTTYKPEIRKYFELVKMAGLISS